MARQTITALFDTRSEAETAVEALVDAGVSRSDIWMTPESEATTSGGEAYDTRRDEKGFWASLSDLFLPDDDRRTYAEAMHRGSFMVAATVEETRADEIADILERHGTVEIDEREQRYRNEGWLGEGLGSTAANTGAGIAGGAASAIDPAAGAAATAPGAGLYTDDSGMNRRSGMETTSGLTAEAGRSDLGARRTTGGEEVIPIVEEHLSVGKRQMVAGRVKVRSYVIETPVSEQVTLHSESVHVERTPVDRAATAEDDLFRERVIEATETSEAAVVAKEARVTEEVRLTREGEDRVETVEDSVRHTEVEIDDDREVGGRVAAREIESDRAAASSSTSIFGEDERDRTSSTAPDLGPAKKR